MPMRSFGPLVILVLVTFYAQSLGAKVCRKPLKGKVGDVIVGSKPCVLSSVTANIITIRDDGNLTVKGISTVKEIKAGDGAIITLKNRTSVDTITSTDSASISVMVEKDSFVKVLALSEAGKTTAQGPFGTIESMNSGVLNLLFSTVKGNVLVQRGRGSVNICGTVIKKQTLIVGRQGQVRLGDPAKNCAGSRFESTVRVVRGGGGMTLQNADAGGVVVGRRGGSVSLSSSSFGKISVSQIGGDVNITFSSVRKETTVENIRGDFTIAGTSFFGEVKIAEGRSRTVGMTTIKESSFQKSKGDVRLFVERRGKLSITSTNFFEGVASLRLNTGPVVFSGNGDVKVSFTRDRRLRIFENNILFLGLRSCAGGALIEKNVIRNGRVVACSGTITIARNVFKTLNCIGNKPAPTGEENAISKSASGQCAKFFR